MSYPNLIPPLIYILGYDTSDDSDDEWEDNTEILNIRKSPPHRRDRSDEFLSPPNTSPADKAPSDITVIKLEQFGNTKEGGAKLARIKIKKSLNNGDNSRLAPSRSPDFSPSRQDSTSPDNLNESRLNTPVKIMGIVPLLFHSIQGSNSDTELDRKIDNIISILNMKNNQLPVAAKSDENKKSLKKEPKQLNPISRTHRKRTPSPDKDEIVDLDHILTRSFRGDVIEPIELDEASITDKLSGARNSVRILLGEIIESCHEDPPEQYRINVSSTRSDRILKSSRSDSGWIDRRLSSIRDGKPQSILKNSPSGTQLPLSSQNPYSAPAQEDTEPRLGDLATPNLISPVLSDRRAKVDKIIDTITES